MLAKGSAEGVLAMQHERISDHVLHVLGRILTGHEVVVSLDCDEYRCKIRCAVDT